MRLVAITGAIVLLLALAASGSAARNPSFAFGRTSGNIEPYTVNIGSTGKISAVGPITLRNEDKRLATTALTRLLGLAVKERFFALPRRVTCAGSLPDFASMFVTVSTATRTRTVVVRGSCSARFEAVLSALQTAAGVPVSQR